MRVEKVIKKPATQVSVVDYYKCELCENKTDDMNNWKGENYCVEKTVVLYESGESYPDNGSSFTKKLDICPTCFKEKLIPWFISQGGQVRNKRCDY